jgi:hypothetical protein
MTVKEQHTALVEYLKAKVAVADWHGVSDAANDLRVLEERMQCNARWEDRSHG